MNRHDIRQFLREVVGPNVKMRDQGEWVSTHCPLAPWTHERGTDANMSFGVKENLYEESVFNCFTCKCKGTLPQFLERMERYTGDTYKTLIKAVEADEFLGGSLPDWDHRQSYDTKNQQLGEPVSDDYLDVYDSAVGHPYLHSRGLDDETIARLDLRIDPDNRGDERILFPVYSPSGAFYGYTGRATLSGVEPRIRDYFGLPKRLVLLGAEFIDTTVDSYIVLTEGLFDFSRGFMFGFPTVASMHSGLTPQQARIFKDLSLPVYVFYDDDEAGHKGRKVIKKELGDHVPLMKVRYPKEKTVYDKELDAMRPPSDPGELEEYQFQHMIADARLL